MERQWLYHTAVPVLLGGCGRAGRLAAAIRLRYPITVHWFGCGWHPLLALFSTRHALSHPVERLSDGVLTRLLCAFADGQAKVGGIVALIPCSDGATAYLERMREELEERFVIAAMPAGNTDPMAGFLRS